MSIPPPRTLRTKRNFKALQLPTGPTLNLAPVGSQSGFRKPPPSSLDPSSSSSTTTSSTSTSTSTTSNATANAAGRSGGLGLYVLSPIPSTGDTPVTSQQRSAIRATITETIAGFPRKSLDLQNEKLVHIREIGQGNGGSVSLVRHRDTDIVMAKKIVLIDAKPAIRKQIVRELQIMHECNSAYIIECYGSYLSDPNICICMEYMDRGSFDSIYKKIGPIRPEVVARVAMSVLEGLTYLYDVHRIIHRDIKPSNILCNTKGEIKLCDFGVSGELINSIANTFVGTSIYMSPERIQGAEYSVKSDIWSLGITLVELATGRFPFSDDESNDFDSNHPFSPQYSSSSLTSGAGDRERFKLPDLDENSVMLSNATANLSLNTTNLNVGGGKGGGMGTLTSTSTSRTPTRRDTFPLPPIPITSPITLSNLGLSSLQHKRLPPIPGTTTTTAHTKTLTSTSQPLPPIPSLPSSSSHTHTHTHTHNTHNHTHTHTHTHTQQTGHTRRKSNGVSLHGGHMTMSIIELMHHIVREPAPKISDTLKFGKEAEDFIAACLEKEVEKRGVPRELLKYEWVKEAKEKEKREKERRDLVGSGGEYKGEEEFDLAEWARALGVEG